MVAAGLVAAPGFDGAVRQGASRIGNDEIQVDVDDTSEAAAGVAGPDGAVEGKQIGKRGGIIDVASGAGQTIAE